MITYIKGRLIEKSPTKIIVESNGIGYEINISLNTYEQIPDDENIKIFTYLQRKEDYIKGRLIEKSPTKIIVESNGIGYEINISLNTYEQIPDDENIKIFTYLQRKEDSDILFGFSSKSERSIFQQLISISGIGPSTARTILSSISPAEIQEAVWEEDVERIKSIKGIGLKTAQRLIIELKDKVELFDKKDIDLSSENLDIKKEALLALSVLGFNKSKSEKIVSKLYFENKDIELQELIKRSLNKL